VKESFNIQELLHHKSKCHETKPMHPLLLESFPKETKNHNLKHPSSVELISTKQTNYLAS
jgi:hypothetical protein